MLLQYLTVPAFWASTMTGASYSDDVFGEQPSAHTQGLHWGRGLWHMLMAVDCKAEKSPGGKGHGIDRFLSVASGQGQLR